MKAGAGFVTACAILVASPASAQPQTGSRIDPNPGAVGAIDSTDEASTRRVMNIFGRCVAARRGRLAQEALALPLGGPAQLRAVDRAISNQDSCLGFGDRELRFNSLLLIGALAEYFVTERLPARDLQALAGLTDAQQDEMGLAPRTIHEDVATCVVRREPASAMAIIRSQPASDGEGAAIRRLLPQFGPCLPAGESVALNASTIRVFAAAGLYRLLSAGTRQGS